MTTKEAFYEHLMELGRKLPPFPEEWKTEDSLVSGCQSIMYLHVEERDGRLYFCASSDALISAGLAALLIEQLSGKTAEEILQFPQERFEEMGIASSLTPGRANGFASLYTKMKRLALSAIVKKNR